MKQLIFLLLFSSNLYSQDSICIFAPRYHMVKQWNNNIGYFITESVKSSRTTIRFDDNNREKFEIIDINDSCIIYNCKYIGVDDIYADAQVYDCNTSMILLLPTSIQIKTDWVDSLSMFTKINIYYYDSKKYKG